MNNINNYISERDSIREEIRKERIVSCAEKSSRLAFISQTEEEILNHYDKNSDDLITFESLGFFDVGKRVSVNERVDFEKTKESKTSMTFLTYMENGGSFGLHSHNCIEIVDIIKGDLIERERGYKVYSEGQQVIYAKNEKHRPYATKDSIYEVTFTKKCT